MAEQERKRCFSTYFGIHLCTFLLQVSVVVESLFGFKKYLDKYIGVKSTKGLYQKKTSQLRRLVSHKSFGLEVPKEGVRQNLALWVSDCTYPVKVAQWTWSVGISWSTIREVLAAPTAFGRHHLVHKMSASAEKKDQDWAMGVNSSFALNQRHSKEVIPSKHG